VTLVGEPAGPWQTISSEVVWETRRLRVSRDKVINPSGCEIDYDWVAAGDQVRVAALVADRILVVEQHHYLAGRLLQLPGGRIEPEEGALASAKRELAEETGYRGGRWTSRGSLFPLPGLTPARVHLWIARNPRPGEPNLEPGEHDLQVHELRLSEAVAAVAAGRIRCAPSATLILLAARKR
jgi:8-oxo-dGTP pyrophosphatase MutT (NUDIX family)